MNWLWETPQRKPPIGIGFLAVRLYLTMGQNPVPPVNIPIQTKINKSGWCTYPTRARRARVRVALRRCSAMRSMEVCPQRRFRKWELGAPRQLSACHTCGAPVQKTNKPPSERVGLVGVTGLGKGVVLQTGRKGFGRLSLGGRGEGLGGFLGVYGVFDGLEGFLSRVLAIVVTAPRSNTYHSQNT